MFEFEKACHAVEQLDRASYEEVLVKKSAEVIAKVSLLSKDGYSGLTLFYGLVLGAVISDGKIEEEEFALIKPMIDLAFGGDAELKEVQEAMRYLKAEAREYKKFIDAIADMLGEVSDEVKDDIVSVCMLICAIDGKISLKERIWLKTLIK